MTTTVRSVSRTELAACPPWCTTDHNTDDETRVHVRTIGELGVEVSALELDGQINAATVYLPILGPGNGGELTTECAAMLAQQLLQAVRLLDGRDT